MRHTRSLVEARGETGRWAGMWEEHPHPAFIFACDGRELHRNAAARRLLSSVRQSAAEDLLSLVRRAASRGPATTVWQGKAVTVVRARPEVQGAAHVLVQLTPAGPDTTAESIAARWRLSAREAEIGVLLARRLSDKEIAETLGISVWTVRAHVRHIFAKVGVSTRSELGQVTATVPGLGR